MSSAPHPSLQDTESNTNRKDAKGCTLFLISHSGDGAKVGGEVFVGSLILTMALIGSSARKYVFLSQGHHARVAVEELHKYLQSPSTVLE